MAADILLIDCGSASGTQHMVSLLAGLRVEVIDSPGTLQERLQDLKTAGPLAVLCLACSQHDESRHLVDATLANVRSKPVIVIDECFDDAYGRLLFVHGVQNYLDVRGLSSEELHRSIEAAVLRNEHRPSALANRWNHIIADGGRDLSELRQILEDLPPREREVLDLLLGRLAPKQIARRLGTRVKTVHGQLASLRAKFEAASTPDLIILVLDAMYQE